MSVPLMIECLWSREERTVCLGFWACFRFKWLCMDVRGHNRRGSPYFHCRHFQSRLCGGVSTIQSSTEKISSGLMLCVCVRVCAYQCRLFGCSVASAATQTHAEELGWWWTHNLPTLTPRTNTLNTSILPQNILFCIKYPFRFETNGPLGSNIIDFVCYC